MNDSRSFDLGDFLANSDFSVVEFCAETNASSKPSWDDLKSQLIVLQVHPSKVYGGANWIVGRFHTHIGNPDVCAASRFALFKGKENIETLPGGDFDALVAAMQKHNFPAEEMTKHKSEDTLSPSITLSSRALDYMWKSSALSNVDPCALPPPRQLGNALSQLRITFLSKIQRNAIRVVKGAQLVEPTLALYCPVEGGEYVVDATVKELAEKTDSEVQVIDMAQVAAGEWGVFGKLASGFRLKENPLGKVKLGENLDADDGKKKNVESFELFWETVINSDPPQTPTATCRGYTDEAASTMSKSRPRIVYIRDFGILAPRVSTWFPPLYSAIRTRRTGGLDSASPITKPTTIIFGICPALSSFLPNSINHYGEDCCCCDCRKPASEWNESATRERAERLQVLNKLWGKGKLLKHLPSFTPKIKISNKKADNTEEEGDSTLDKSEQGTEESHHDSAAESEKGKKTAETFEVTEEDLLAEAGQTDSGSDGSSSSESSDDDEEKNSGLCFEQKLDGYFRSCIITPAERNSKLESASRKNRRRELSEVMIRMAVGIRGGEIESSPVSILVEWQDNDRTDTSEVVKSDMLKEWEERLMKPKLFKEPANRALEIAMLSNEGEGEEENGQTTVAVTWAQIQEAWKDCCSDTEERDAWTKSRFLNEDGENQMPLVDEIVEQVKAEDLDEYEERLIGCIVDVAKLSTTFENVHLPTNVIDGVRSIVSLPLLFPDAFKSGVLKEQAISGALLFGPPGTGKTLLLAIKPSDVSDMWVGETEKLVRSVFKLGRRLKPCVVFIDEIDSIMGSRTGSSCSGSSRWHTSMLTEFMQEMDGLLTSNVVVIGATNRPFDVDDAVLRRLPCRLLIDLPGAEAREEILKIILRNDRLATDVNISELARKTDRFSGSDLKHLCVAAAMDALKETVKLPWLTNQNHGDVSTVKSDNTTESVKGATMVGITDDKISDVNWHTTLPPSTDTATPQKPGLHVLAARHFAKALMESTPSSSESQASLSELRKWNAQFGTGARGQSRNNGSLPYSYIGTNTSSLPGVSGLPNYGLNGSMSTGLGPNRFTSQGLGLPTPGASDISSTGLASTRLGSLGLSPSGPSSAGLNLRNSFQSDPLGRVSTIGPNTPGSGGLALATRGPPLVSDIPAGQMPKLPLRRHHNGVERTMGSSGTDSSG